MFFQKSYSSIIKLSIKLFSLSIVFTGCLSSTPPTNSTNNQELSSQSPMPLKEATSNTCLSDPTVPSTPYEKDATRLIEDVESQHPAFLLDDVSEAYYKEKESYLEAVKKDISLIEFKMLTQKFLATLNDAHTCIDFEFESYLALNCVANKDGDIVLWDEELNMPSQKKITEIGGKSFSTITDAIDTYWVAENDTALLLNHATHFSKEFLEYIGCDIHDNQVEVAYELDGVTQKINVPILSENSNSSTSPTQASISSKWIGDIFYIDVNTCFLQCNNEFKQQLQLLREALNQDLHKVIIDVRNNSGGYPEYCNSLLRTMHMMPPTMGEFSRDIGFHDSSLSSASPNKDINLVVLVNELTFSAATILATCVQDGNLGTIIGRPSSNSPTFYGKIHEFKLPNSQITGKISQSRLYRPNNKADQITLHPDILTDFSEDSLERAIHFLNEGN